MKTVECYFGRCLSAHCLKKDGVDSDLENYQSNISWTELIFVWKARCLSRNTSKMEPSTSGKLSTVTLMEEVQLVILKETDFKYGIV